MGRLDYESGRFDADYEVNDVNRVLRGYETDFGDSIQYWKYWQEQSTSHNLWDEPSGSGLMFHEPVDITVIHANHVEGGIERRAEGAYYNDELYVTASFEVLRRLGFSDLDIQHYTFQRDRVVYDWRVFRVTRIQVTGQIQRRDIMVSIEGTQVRPDEMTNDPQFVEFSTQRFGPS